MFISFEGIDGSGKSTQARLLSHALRSRGHDVLDVREPGGSALGERVRSLLLDPEAEITPRAELLLFSAARAHLVDTVIRPALSEGTIVIADRFFDSTTAYQGAGRGVASVEELEPFHAFVTASLVPDRTYLLDLDPDTALGRAESRSTPDRMEQADRAFYARVAEAYSRLATLYPRRIARIDADPSQSAVHRTILTTALDAIEGGSASPGSGRH